MTASHAEKAASTRRELPPDQILAGEEIASSDRRLLIVNGPNLGVLGERQPEIYGRLGMDALADRLPRLCRETPRIACFQSNHEGELIDRLELARRQGVDGIVLNAGAFTHTSLALADCLAWIRLPCVEVHLSNVLARTDQPLRRQSLIAGQVIGVISGFGLDSYVLAVQALMLHLDARDGAQALRENPQESDRP